MRRRAGGVALLAACVLAVAGLAVAGGSGSTTTDDLDPSSRSGGPGGTLALYSWLVDLGLDVHRVSGGFDLGAADVLVLVQPTVAVSDADADAVMAFLHQGGELILALDGGTAVDNAAPLLDRLGQGVVDSIAGGGATPVQPLEPGEHIRSIAMAGTALDLRTGEGAPLLSLRGTTVMRGFSVGSGRAYVLGSAYPLRNEGLRATRPDQAGTLSPTGSDAAILALAMLEHTHPLGTPALRVGFDEVHHGEGAGGGAAQVLVSPLGLAALLAAVMVVGFLAGAGRRLGRPVPAGDPTRVPSADTYIDAMAALFARSAKRGAVAARFADELKARVGSAGGADPALEDAAFVASLAGFGEDRQGEVARVLGRARELAAGSPGEADLLALVREVDAVERRWTAGAPV